MAKMSAQDWIEEIDRALAYREAYSFELAWRKNELNYTHNPSSHAARGPNLVYEMGDVVLSEIGMLDPEFTVTPTHPAAANRWPIVESIDNYLARQMGMKKCVKRAALNSYLYHRAIIKLGYDSEFGWSPRLDIGSREQPVGMSLSQFNMKTGARIENKNVKPGMPWISSVLPHDFVVPWGTIDLENAPWCAHRVIRLNEDVKADKKYKNTSRLEPNMSIEDYVESYLSPGSPRIRAKSSGFATMNFSARPRSIYNELWEIHDRREMRIKVVCRDHDSFLRDEPDAVMLACGMPFVSGTFTEHPRSFWGTPLAFYLGQLQADQFDISTQEEKQRRISILRFIAAKGLMSQEAMQKLLSGDVGAVAFANVPDNLRDRLITVPTGNLLDFALQTNRVRQDARSLIGFSRNQAGEFDVGTRRTKGEAMLVAAGSEMRQSPRISMAEDLYIETMGKVNQIIFTYWTVPRYIASGDKWVRFTNEEIKGDYLYDLTLSQKRKISRAQRRVEAIWLISQIAPLLQGADPKEILQYVVDATNDPAFEKLLGVSRPLSPVKALQSAV